MNYSKKIYKKDSTGKVRVLHIYTIGAELYQESGVLGGAMVVNKSTSKPKNLGKANETTPEQQAVLEAKSKIEKKMTAGYFDTIEETQTEEVILPMLAKSFGDESHKINWNMPVYIQPKFDGMRCLAILRNGEVTLMSRQGKVIENCDHIIKALEPVAKRMDIVLDGEIYAHGKTFQENMRLVKKYREGETEQLQYNIYDIVDDEHYTKRFSKINEINFNNETICIVKNITLVNPEDIKSKHAYFIGEGYEGSIIRHGQDGYAINKRSSSLLKYKDFIDISCKVIDVIPSDKRPEQGICVCELDNGDTFSTGMKFSHEERELILTNKHDYIGEIAEIRFFEYSEEGIPRFPVCVGFRLDK
jgi:DNA ligase-1